MIKKILRSKAVHWTFVAVTRGFGGYEIARQWGQITRAPGRPAGGDQCQ